MNPLNWFSLAISVASAAFAGAAWWTNREKLRLDLYNRRFQVYTRTLDFVHMLFEWHPSDQEREQTSLQDSPRLKRAQRAFIKASRESQFLFDDSSGIHKLLEEVNADTIGMIGYKRDIARKMNRGPEMMTFYNEFQERQNRAHAAIFKLEEKLKPYLNFHSLSEFGQTDL